MALLRVGQIVSSYVTGYRYHVDGLLGAGGYGEVFRAHRIDRRGHRLGPDVCVKITLDEQSWHREAYFGELLADSKRVIAVLDSFPRPLGVGSSRRMTYCLVLELAEHGSLANYLAKLDRPWSEEHIRREVLALLGVLVQLHGTGAVHRDLTPFNVFVCRGARLKLGDFGIARHAPTGGRLVADEFNRWFASTGIAFGDYKRWLAADDVWQMGQLLGVLVRTDATTTLSTRDVRDLDCSDDLKGVIRRAIGPRAHRFEDAFEMIAAIETPHALRRGGVRTLRGKTVVFTGRLAVPRAEAEEWVRQVGGEVARAVSQYTDVIVVGALSPSYVAGSQGVVLLEAQSLCEDGCDIRLIDERQFLRLVGAA